MNKNDIQNTGLCCLVIISARAELMTRHQIVVCILFYCMQLFKSQFLKVAFSIFQKLHALFKSLEIDF